MAGSAGGRAVAPSALASSLSLVNRRFTLGRQEDAHEFLVSLLDVVERACEQRTVLPSLAERERHHTWSDASRLPPALPPAAAAVRPLPECTLFRGVLTSRITCTHAACGAASDTRDLFETLSLEMKDASVAAALGRFAAVEALDADNRYKCERCHHLVCATKGVAIEVPPAVLVIHLKRFIARGWGYTKNSMHVDFDAALDLSPAVRLTPAGAAAASSAARGAAGVAAAGAATSNDVAAAAALATADALMYDLAGVVVHHGSSMHGGHYTAYVAGRGDGEWWEMNDSHTRWVSREEVLGQQAFMLVYLPRRSAVLAAIAATCVLPLTTPPPPPPSPPATAGPPAPQPLPALASLASVGAAATARPVTLLELARFVQDVITITPRQLAVNKVAPAEAARRVESGLDKLVRVAGPGLRDCNTPAANALVGVFAALDSGEAPDSDVVATLSSELALHIMGPRARVVIITRLHSAWRSACGTAGGDAGGVTGNEGAAAAVPYGPSLPPSRPPLPPVAAVTTAATSGVKRHAPLPRRARSPSPCTPSPPSSRAASPSSPPSGKRRALGSELRLLEQQHGVAEQPEPPPPPPLPAVVVVAPPVSAPAPASPAVAPAVPAVRTPPPSSHAALGVVAMLQHLVSNGSASGSTSSGHGGGGVRSLVPDYDDVEE